MRRDNVLSKQKECGKKEIPLLLVKRKLKTNSIPYLIPMFPPVIDFSFLERKKLFLSLLLMKEMITKYTLKEKLCCSMKS